MNSGLGWVTLGWELELGQSQSWLNERTRLCQAGKCSISHCTSAQYLPGQILQESLQGIVLEMHIPIPHLRRP